MPPGNGFGTSGVSDFNALLDGAFFAIETKFGNNKPTALQVAFAGHVIANASFAFCVNEGMLGVLDIFFENFRVAQKHQLAGETVPPDVGARMLNATDIMTNLWALPKASKK